MELSLGEIASILGTSVGVADRRARGYSIDSRTLQPGDLFFALRGPRFDGHGFVRQALERGAAGAVVEAAFAREASVESASALLAVPDTACALRDLAQSVRRRWGRRIVAVTGSTGKTTTKEMIAAALAARFSVLKSLGNLNNQFGVPLALLALEPHHQAAVLELGMSAAGEIAGLARICEPEIGVVTNVAPAHLEFFDSVDAIARAKRELIENLASPATAVLNFDDERVRGFAQGFEGAVVTFGFGQGADFRASILAGDAENEEFGTRFRVKAGGRQGDFFVPLRGRYNVENALAAVAVADTFGEDWSVVAQALRNFQPLPQRASVSTLANGSVLIDDSYNSNPRAMEQMLETLGTWPGARRRMVIAGEMLELGPSSPQWHREVGGACFHRADWLVGVQGNARFFLEGAEAAGLPRERMRFFASAEEAAAFCRRLIKAGDVVLVKGSRAVHLETVVEAIRQQAESSHE